MVVEHNPFTYSKDLMAMARQCMAYEREHQPIVDLQDFPDHVTRIVMAELYLLVEDIAKSEAAAGAMSERSKAFLKMLQHDEVMQNALEQTIRRASHQLKVDEVDMSELGEGIEKMKKPASKKCIGEVWIEGNTPQVILHNILTTALDEYQQAKQLQNAIRQSFVKEITTSDRHTYFNVSTNRRHYFR